jgi:glutathione peroxidase
MAKTDVNGPSQHPIFAWLKQHTPPEPGHQEGEDIAWNFAKFLLDKHGHPVKRYGSELDYHSLELDCYNELIKLH